MTRPDNRKPEQLRPIKIETGVQKDPAGSVQISFGNTVVLCAATLSERLPPWLKGQGRGWITAEYAMLPGAVPERAGRKPNGRSREIQRLIGRSLRAAIDLDKFGEHMLTVDCDVLQADGGTRTASITGGYIAVAMAVDKLIAEGKLEASPLIHQLSAVSCVIVDGACVLDPCYDEDHRAEVDANFVYSGDGKLVEIQATAEGKPFDDDQLAQMLSMAKAGAKELFTHQQSALEKARKAT